MDIGRPVDIRVGHNAIIIAPENSPAPRYIYTARTTHISSEIYDPSTNGDSVAHWEGNTLVVDTIGFHDTRGVLGIPGGGFKTSKTHLVERYTLLNNGQVLSVEFTVTDPTVYRAPHTFDTATASSPGNTNPLRRVGAIPMTRVGRNFLKASHRDAKSRRGRTSVRRLRQRHRPAMAAVAAADNR